MYHQREVFLASYFLEQVEEQMKQVLGREELLAGFLLQPVCIWLRANSKSYERGQTYGR